MRATALLIADASPAWRSSTAASTVAVSGATVMTSPRPSTSVAGSTPFQYVTPGASRANNATPTPATIGPTVICRRGPMRCASAPLRAENRNMSTVIGSSDAPAASGEYPSRSWR